ncbi:YbaB/EbfC family nucleoid-associated protein [Saccharopolyspora sp. HNM0983]|uniref:YbaB/EbfC family nucleoid-associated protein n=1 Tax=Saccharopolyspora montiporae TaxID=2781240 RepID=A0A929G1Q5_9PSEU|nr:YbaB/EbfC family nucleoid-associated protein [Saccharopolyspora sp. HNM0983]MBE9376524.1 YbaB/EbfC family nucleoid-associated protein [Saccharopolyspora sp. HNM0983]
MRQLEHNAEKATRNPEAVLNGSFSATSGNVTVWVDTLGRTEYYRIAPNSVFEGDEIRLIEGLNAATQEARRKADHLEFDEESDDARAQPASERPKQQPSWYQEPPHEGNATWLH